ncbi:hypothetical protein AJ79_08982 [Helicocarpus griseus UAMH5409]|uniref:Cytochrome P450 oxidoreductase n=1 Tax=Helicocarpus griseus UAMH5409 TaxID=1447875 RepID=A0A2B7WNM4_9EURO|nr:hypothetical protein AJ79_08982 [Helicocarpus griseus UAMH5409]
MALSTIVLNGSMSDVVLVAVGIAFCYAIVRFVQVRLSRLDIPQPPHSFWFGHLGVVRKFNKAYPPDAAIHHLKNSISREYNLPDIYYLDLWPLIPPTVVVCSPELAAQVTTEQSCPKSPEIEKFLSPFLGKSNIISLNGKKWKELHAVFAPAFAPAYLRTLTDGMVDEVQLYRDKLSQLANSHAEFSMAKLTSI